MPHTAIAQTQSSAPLVVSEREARRWLFRSRLFQQHGWPEERAEAWAEKLVGRDRDGDDRRLCVECKNLLSQWRCAERGPVLAEVLQRCPTFQWETPKQ